MDVAAIRKLTPDERADKVLQLRKELMETRFRRSAQALDKTHELRTMRRDIARLKTIAQEKDDAAAITKDAKAAAATEKTKAAKTKKDKKDKKDKKAK